jgi:hypothetical protein
MLTVSFEFSKQDRDMERVRFIEHKGKTILFIDFSDSSPEDAFEVIGVAKTVIAKQAPSSLLTLTNTHNARFNSKIRNAMTEYVRHNKPFVKAAAIIGVTGLQEIIFSGILKLTKRKIRLFNDIEEAKDWLAIEN